MAGVEKSSEQDLREPSPYNKAWYEMARQKGASIISTLVKTGSMPRASLILETIYNLIPKGTGNPNDAYASDLLLEELAGAQDASQSIYRIRISSGPDYTKLAPSARFRPPEE